MQGLAGVIIDAACVQDMGSQPAINDCEIGLIIKQKRTCYRWRYILTSLTTGWGSYQ